jgi:hypothetical protein
LTEDFRMALIGTRIEPRRVTRMFFDCVNAAPDPADPLRIARAIESSLQAVDNPSPPDSSGPAAIQTRIARVAGEAGDTALAAVPDSSPPDA